MEQLRATLKSDLQEKNDILDKLTHERGELYIVQDSETRDNNIYQNDSVLPVSSAIVPFPQATISCPVLSLGVALFHFMYQILSCPFFFNGSPPDFLSISQLFSRFSCNVTANTHTV